MPNVCCGDYDCGPDCFWVCRDNRLAGRCSATATAEPDIINLNQHYDDGDPYDSQVDSVRTLSGFLH